MAAPSIPNLLGMRGDGRARGGRVGIGDGGGGGAGGPSADAVVQGTDTDAAVSRLSAVRLGYLDDAYAEGFVSGPPTRRLPIINRGTFVRTRALDIMVSAFLSAPDDDDDGDKDDDDDKNGNCDGRGPKQIISLGAGTDTRPFRLLASAAHPHLIYHEIDFEPTCRRKYQAARAMPALAGELEEVEAAEGGSWSARWRRGGGEYHCHAADLRAVDGLAAAMGAAVRTDVPTLLLSECCLCYLTQRESERVLDLFQTRIARLAVAVYEPMPLDDSFGQVMVHNLRARGIRMPSLERFRDAAAQERRLRDAGLGAVGHATVAHAWEAWVADADKARLDALEGLDEVEEWQLLAAHYVVAWGARRTGFARLGRTATASAPQRG